ncbi:hypothetical protein NLI96_g614 [Meripilus lineatus]|uniref:F-box domain-containing protein n=1 Tax=Meripilus lineatus TaxID=2056292 RepID=A0AAD5VGA8_9APHY|nr:hypothetical protein NLI96_g614 [Physisporinus lineatus]
MDTTSTLVAGSLPLCEDILDIVMSQLCDDKTSLSRISLVSKLFMVIARRHLFRTIAVEGVITTPGRRLPPRYGFWAFNEFLLSSRETSYLIQDISLIDNNSGRRASLDYNLLGQILSNLPSLRNLTLDCINWKGRIEEDRDDSRIFVPTSLRHLSITNSSVQGEPEGFTGKQNLFDLFALFSTIDTLRFSSTNIPGEHHYPSIINSPECQRMEIPPYVQVRSLVFRGKLEIYTLEAIRKSGSLGTLKDVSLPWYSWEDLVAVGAFLRGVGQGIQNISFTPERTFGRPKRCATTSTVTIQMVCGQY